MSFTHGVEEYVINGKDVAATKPIASNVPDTDKHMLMTEYMQRVAHTRCKRAFSALFAWYAPKVKRYMLSMGASDGCADELTQETFMAVWMKAVSYDPQKAAVTTWIYRVARNKFIDVYRKNRRVQLNTILYAAECDGPDDGKSVLERSIEYSQIAEALNELPESQQTVLEKMYMEGCTQEEVAEELGIPIGTVKSRARLAYRKLRAQITVDD